MAVTHTHTHTQGHKPVPQNEAEKNIVTGQGLQFISIANSSSLYTRV